MQKTIEYFYAMISPWTYLGAARFQEIADRHNATVIHKPVDLIAVFGETGGLPLSKRHPARQEYRLQELERWSQFLDVPLNVKPKHFPTSEALAARLVLSLDTEPDKARLSLAIHEACWRYEQDVADPDQLKKLLENLDLDAAAIMEKANTDAAAQKLAANTQEAIDRQIFGAPAYILDREMFWGQDRLEILDWRLGQQVR